MKIIAKLVSICQTTERGNQNADYKITCFIDGKIFVGKTTKTLNERMRGHLSNKSHSLIDEAIQEFGIENFKIEVIAECETVEELNELEKYWIHKLDCKFPNGYNLIGYDTKCLKLNNKNSVAEKTSEILDNGKIITSQKYEKVYADLRNKIETQEYIFNSLVPSENELTKIYSCSRSTVRRALSELINRGYVQVRQGSRVRVIYEPVERNIFKISGIESFKEAAIRNGFTYDTKVVLLEKIIADEEISSRTGFKIGDELYDVRRVRYINDKALILDKNYFLVSVAHDLTEEIARKSIYDYLENTLNVKIMTSKRKMTTELATSEDKKYLELADYNCLAIVSGRVFSGDGIQFEYTESRHRPDYFCFEDTATRHKFKG